MNDTTFQGDGKVAYVPVVVSAKQQPMTNGDQIRSMTDEELAGEMFELANYACPPGKEFTRTSCGKNPECNNCWLDWLQQEAD